MIAMALLFSPELIVMDEPTSALDVVAQRALMVQIKELQRELGFAIIFVTHDMSLVSHFSDRLAVMYAGQVAELGPPGGVRPIRCTRTPSASRCVPLGLRAEGVHRGHPGRPARSGRPAGCSFAPRCPKAMAVCTDREPEFYQVRRPQGAVLPARPGGGGDD